MARRPKFWIHRSGRFWRGFAVFLFLFAAWVLTMFSHSEVRYSHSDLSSARVASLTLEDGGLRAAWTTEIYKAASSRAPSPRSDWDFDLRESHGARLSPEFSRKTSDWRYGSETNLHLFLPLWLPLLAWTVFWIYRMYRQDQREEKMFGEQTGGEDVPAGAES